MSDEINKLFNPQPRGAPVEADGLRAVHKPERWDFVRQTLANADEESWLGRLSQEKRDRVARTHLGLKNGTHVSGPLWCFGPAKCPFHQLCPVADTTEDGEVVEAPLGDYPLGRHCVLESAYYRQMVVDYMTSLEVNHQDPVEMAMVKELALIDLQKQRALNIMSVGDVNDQGRDFLLRQEVVIQVGDGSATNEMVSLHPIIQMLDRLEARREKWLTKLLATRKDRVDAQAKLGQKEEQLEVNNVIIEMREHFKGMRSGAGDEKLLPLD